MKFGLHITAFEPSTNHVEDIYPELRSRALWAEGIGFQYLSLQDHLCQFQFIGSPNEPILEPWTTLAALAEATATIKLLTLVSNMHYRGPALLAKMASTLDAVSKGRLILGLGAGGNLGEEDKYGYEALTFENRKQRLDESVEIIKALWRNEIVTYKGKFWNIKGATHEPKPPHQPSILIAGNSSGMLQIAARQADLCDLNMIPPDAVSSKIKILEQHLLETGRNRSALEVTSMQRIILRRTKEEAVSKFYKQDRYPGIIGTPEEAIDAISKFEAKGISILFLMIPFNDQITRDLLEKHVIKRF